MSTPQPPAPQPPNGPSNPDANYRAILDYLTKRGHHKAALALTTDLEGSAATTAAGGAAAAGAAGSSRPASPAPGAAAGGGKSVGLDDFAERNAPSAPRGGAGGAGAGPGQRRRMDESVARGQMLADPPSWEKGYEGLRAFVENSLDIHRPELHPLLLPLFVHSYLDLVLVGYRDAADSFLARFSPDHAAMYPSLIRLLSSLRLPQHVSENQVALRWRQERYHVRLSERGWGLLLGWLQGGGVIGSEGTEGRGRDRVLAIINERVKVDAVPGPPLPTSLTSHGLSTDYFSLQSGGLPPGAPPPGADGGIPELKLGIPEVGGQLEREVKRRLRDEDGEEEEEGGKEKVSGVAGGEGAAPGEGEAGGEKPADETGEESAAEDKKDDKAEGKGVEKLLAPFPADLPPYPSTFRTLDVLREVELVREARKRIRLGAEAFKPDGQLITAATAAAGQGAGGVGVGPGEAGEKGKGVGKPSVCLFTVHDAGESYVQISSSPPAP
ncbi:hypothetical protein JCM11251_004669, partial [Rhodosporidiobolus azoricus]